MNKEQKDPLSSQEKCLQQWLGQKPCSNVSSTSSRFNRVQGKSPVWRTEHWRLPSPAKPHRASHFFSL